MILIPRKRKETNIEIWLSNKEKVCPSCEHYGDRILCGQCCVCGDMYSPKEGEEGKK